MSANDPQPVANHPPDGSRERVLRAALDYFTGPLSLTATDEARELAARQLLALGDHAYPLIELAASQPRPNLPAVLELLAKFERPESVPILRRILLEGTDDEAWGAAQALAGHPADAAREALREGLQAARTGILRAALGGRGSPTTGPELVRRVAATTRSQRSERASRCLAGTA